MYVDTEQKTLSNITKHKISSNKSSEKYKNARIAIKKQKTGSYDNLNNIGKESVELVRKDSLDSKLAGSYSNTDAEFQSDCSSHSFEHEGLDISLKEQNIKTLKSFTSKTKNMKEDVGTKKKTKVLIHNNKNISNLDNSKNYFLNLQNTDNLEKRVPDFANEVYCIEEKIPSSIHIKPVYGEIPSISQVNQSNNFFVKNSGTDLLPCGEQLNCNTEELNYNGLKDLIIRTERNDKNFNTKFNYDKKQIEKASENMKQFDIDFKNEIDNKTDEINLVGASSISLTENPENSRQLNVPEIENLTSLDNSCMHPHEKIKHKQSLTSLIRKLSLKHKAKSVDDETYSKMETSDKVWNTEIEDENNSELPGQSINRKLYLI